MSTRDEQARALEKAGNFLAGIAQGSSQVSEDVKETAFSILRHYPMPGEIKAFWKTGKRDSGNPVLDSVE